MLVLQGQRLRQEDSRGLAAGSAVTLLVSALLFFHLQTDPNLLPQLSFWKREFLMLSAAAAVMLKDMSRRKPYLLPSALPFSGVSSPK